MEQQQQRSSHPLIGSSTATDEQSASGTGIVAEMMEKVTVESSIKYAGGVVAALIAMKYAGSLKSACVIGVFSGLVAHSFYADVLKNKLRLNKEKQQLVAPKDSETASTSASDTAPQD